MSSSVQNEAPAKSASHRGQVCDRCRQKKIKCDGGFPSCSNCVTAKVPCECSEKLRRRTTVRGQYTSSDSNQNLIERLQREVTELRDQLQAPSRDTRRLGNEEEAVSEVPVTSARRRKTPRTLDRPTSNSALSPAVSLSAESEKLDPKHSTYVIRHMGRLVTDDSDIGRFAGSTTGVHFVSSVEEVCRRRSPSIEPFHEDCFRLHLLQPRLRFDISGFNLKSVALPGADDTLLHHLQILLAQPLDSHARQLDIFLETWLAFCPVIPRQWFLRCIEQMPSFDGEFSDQWQHGRACATLHTLLLIGFINKTSGQYTFEDEALQIWDDPQFFGLIHQLQGPITALGDAWCLQSLIIFSFFLQITGRTGRMVQLNGTLVRLAQSLGMHRHTRRFRFGQSENELRNRMWWWVYGFDKTTSIVHGLPQLIQDSDVDTDLPVDCEVRDIDGDHPPYPLPGESTPVALYVHYVKLSNLLSTILDQLYTTSHRRGGAEKIARLDRDLRVWHHVFINSIKASPFEIGDADHSVQGIPGQHSGQYAHGESVMIAWLEALANYTMILIHRPALTFDPTSTQFRHSLNTCLRSSTAIIQLMDAVWTDEQVPFIPPLGPSLLFQSALTHVFYHCNVDNGTLSAGAVGQDGTSIISSAISTLKKVEYLYTQEGTRGQHLHNATNHLLSACTFISNKTSTLPGELGPGPVDQPTSSAFVSRDFATTAPDPEFWNSSALENLNQFNVFDWDFGDISPYIMSEI